MYSYALRQETFLDLHVSVNAKLFLRIEKIIWPFFLGIASYLTNQINSLNIPCVMIVCLITARQL